MSRNAIYLALIGLATGSFIAAAVAGNGNNSPTGPHYNLNLIGMESPKNKDPADTQNSNGKRIFVKLSGKTKILLSEAPEGESFDVIDYDGTDGVAVFQLPNPDANCDGTTDYTVWVRALGGGGSSQIKTCATMDFPNEDGYCSAYTNLEIGGAGNKTFTNVSKELLYVTGDFGDGIKHYPLFGDELYDYYWDYLNSGLRLAQLRFYEGQYAAWPDTDTDCTFPTTTTLAP